MQPYPQYPPAFTSLDGKEVWLMQSEVPTAKIASCVTPGQITAVSKNEIEVACGNGCERIKIKRLHLKDDLKADILSLLSGEKIFKNSES